MTSKSYQGRVVIVVQHLLGAGHLIRAMLLAEALAKSNCHVILFSGGFPIDRAVNGYEFFQLPSTQAKDTDFTNLVDEQGQRITDDWRQRRADILLSSIRNFKPDIVITETFPFGRRQFRFELEPLIQWVQKQKKVRLIASIRDILQRRTNKRNQQTVETLKQYYDAVLVHGDEQLFNLQASFDLTKHIQHLLHYTGYIQPSRLVKNTHQTTLLTNEIIVAGGTGTVSRPLLKTANVTSTLFKQSKYSWRLLTGLPLQSLNISPNNNVVIEKNRPDYYTLLSNCALSISQAGYNTSLDILSSGVRSLMVPFSGDGETEQTDRAQALAQAGRVVCLSESNLSPNTLTDAVKKALALPFKKLNIQTDGAANSAVYVTTFLNKQPK